jgi:uncharacterized protein YutD
MSHDVKYEVVYLVQFTKTRVVAASSPDEAKKKAEEMERKFQKVFQKSDYIIGDIEMLEAVEMTPKYKAARGGWERERIYHVGD